MPNVFDSTPLYKSLITEIKGSLVSKEAFDALIAKYQRLGTDLGSRNEITDVSQRCSTVAELGTLLFQEPSEEFVGSVSGGFWHTALNEWQASQGDESELDLMGQQLLFWAGNNTVKECEQAVKKWRDVEARKKAAGEESK